VDRLEEELTRAKQKAVPEQEAASKLLTEEKFVSDLEEKKKNDPSFAMDRNVKQWRQDEVCFWMNLVGFGEYVNSFREKKKSLGTYLVTDMDNDFLSRELGVKRIHINQILREIQELKKRAFGYLEESGIICDACYTPGIENRELRAIDRFAAYEKDLGQLQQQLTEIRTQLEHLTTEHNSALELKENLQKELSATQENLQTTKESLHTNQVEIEQLKEQSTKELAQQAQEKIAELNQKMQRCQQRF